MGLILLQRLINIKKCDAGMQADQLWMINGKRKWIHFQKKSDNVKSGERERERSKPHGNGDKLLVTSIDA